MKVITDIYRSTKKEGLYLYVPAGQELNELPPTLMTSFGRAEYAMKIVLTKDKKLARAEVEEVMSAIEDQGFYLQMPPVIEVDER